MTDIDPILIGKGENHQYLLPAFGNRHGLVTGATGTGKTTTLAALCDKINKEKTVHVVTLEDPIEFVHPHKNCTFNQRELGNDYDTFPNGLRAALRQAPKVILVGEMRDRETMEIGLSAAETGHLVMSTLHTVDSGQTINRILGFFDQEEQPQNHSKHSEQNRSVRGPLPCGSIRHRPAKPRHQP